MVHCKMQQSANKDREEDCYKVKIAINYTGFKERKTVENVYTEHKKQCKQKVCLFTRKLHRTLLVLFHQEFKSFCLHCDCTCIMGKNTIKPKSKQN